MRHIGLFFGVILIYLVAAIIANKLPDLSNSTVTGGA